VDEASEPAETLLKVSVKQPDALVMELALLEVEGENAAIAIRKAHPGVAILFLTNEDGPKQQDLAIAAGARGYMLKSSTPGQLVAALREVVLSSEDQNPRSLSRIVPDLRALAQTNDGFARPTILTSREHEVMKLLAEGRKVREVASELALSVKTVEAHKLNLMRKLDIHNRASLVEYAVQNGVVTESVTV